MSKERSTQTPTMVSGPAPSDRRWCASWLARASSSRYVRVCVLVDQRCGVGRACGLPGEQLRQRGVRDLARGVVPVGQDGAALGGRENVESADRTCGLGDGGGQQPHQALGERGGARFLEQVAGIFQHPVDAGRCAVGGALLGERERQVELGAGDRHLLEAGAQPRKLEAARCASFWNASITWNSG